MGSPHGSAEAVLPIRDLPAFFAAAMARLGPFEAAPRLAIAVSGGPDSTALALLGRDWAASQGGGIHGFIVDHGLRPDSGTEARLTASRLAALSIPATILPLTGLHRGPALADRARGARYAALAAACRDGGFLHLLLGHHAADQAETLAMRALRDSGDHGLAGMPALAEARDVRLLRPLLAVPPALLRGFLSDKGVAWVEDPSNRDPATLRARLRDGLAGADPMRLVAASMAAGRARADMEEAIATELAAVATIRPEGIALLPLAPMRPRTLGALLQAIGGAPYPPAGRAVTALAATPGAATLAGVRMLVSRGRLLLAREEAAMDPPVPAAPGMRWDGRMRLLGPVPSRQGITIGALGADTPRFRHATRLPAAVLRTLPVLRRGPDLLAVPHMGYANGAGMDQVRFVFDPPRAAAAGAFCPISSWGGPTEGQEPPKRVFSSL